MKIIQMTKFLEHVCGYEIMTFLSLRIQISIEVIHIEKRKKMRKLYYVSVKKWEKIYG